MHDINECGSQFFFFAAKPSKKCYLFKIRLCWEKSKAKLLNSHKKIKLCVFCLCSCRTHGVAFVGLMIIVISFSSAVGRVLSVNDIYCTTFVETHTISSISLSVVIAFIATIAAAAAAAAVVVVIKHRLQWNSTQCTNKYTETTKSLHKIQCAAEYGPIDMLKLNDK